MEQYSVDVYSVILPSVSSPPKAFYGISPYKYRIEPEVVAVDQPYIGEPVQAPAKVSGLSAKIDNPAAEGSAKIRRAG